MRSILYWSFLILAAVLLARLSPFNLAPMFFLGGVLLLAAGYFTFLSYRRRQSGVAEHGAFQSRIIGTLLVYIMVYWTTVGLFMNEKQQREFLARYEPYM